MKKLLIFIFLSASFLIFSCDSKDTGGLTDKEAENKIEDDSQIEDDTELEDDAEVKDDTENEDDQDAISDDDSSVFRTKWEIKNGGDSIILPLVENGEYDFIVYWGDGTKDNIKNWDDPAVTHEYADPGIYEVLIKGFIKGWSFGENKVPCRNLIEVSNWGTLAFGETDRQFYECFKLEITAEDVPDLSITESLRFAFFNCSSLNDNTSWNKWNVSGVTNMVLAFAGSSFNSDISGWNVSNVTDVGGMFSSSKFNGDISNWDVSKVTNMKMMFFDASFNGDVSSWNVSNVANMEMMFFYSSFNDDISSWNVAKVKDMSYLFGSSPFNGDISNWDVSSVSSMNGMFLDSKFNGDISSWDVSNVEEMKSMFANSQFNGDISNWDVSNVYDMQGMFSSSRFNGNISSWDISNVWNMDGMFYATTLPTEYYDEMLIKWSELPARNDVVFGGGFSKYSAKAIEARTKIITEFNWTIFDGGLDQLTDEE